MKLRPQPSRAQRSSLALEAYTHVAGEDNERFAEQSDLILCPNAQKKENGSKAVARDLWYLNQKFVAGVRFELTSFGL
jgi:hypothetical protein